MYRRSFIFITLCIIQITFCRAETELVEKSRKANIQDIIGRWEMTYQVVRPTIMNDSLFFAKFQLFDISNDGFVKNLTSKNILNEEVIQNLFENMPVKTRYLFSADGFLNISRSDRDVDSIVISIIEKNLLTPLRKDAPILKKGNLILSYLDPDQKLYMQRYLRRRP